MSLPGRHRRRLWPSGRARLSAAFSALRKRFKKASETTPLVLWPLAKFDHSHPQLIPFSTPDYDTKPLEPTR